jgi:hypothetical protein
VSSPPQKKKIARQVPPYCHACQHQHADGHTRTGRFDLIMPSCRLATSALAMQEAKERNRQKNYERVKRSGAWMPASGGAWG